MRLFDAMISSIMRYGAEIWGWSTWKEIERVQERYLKWIFKANKTTPSHTLRKEARRVKLAIRMGKAAVKYERKLCYAKEGTLLKECWETAKKKKKREENNKKKEEFLRKRGWSVEEMVRKIEEGKPVWIELEERSKDIEKQERREELERSKYAAEIRKIITEELRSKYQIEEERKRRNETEVIGRFRLGCESKANKYWLKAEEKMCRLCRKEPETLEHIIEKCSQTGNSNRRWEQVLRKGGENIHILQNIRWKRKRKEKEERRQAQEQMREERE